MESRCEHVRCRHSPWQGQRPGVSSSRRGHGAPHRLELRLAARPLRLVRRLDAIVLAERADQRRRPHPKPAPAVLALSGVLSIATSYALVMSVEGSRETGWASHQASTAHLYFGARLRASSCQIVTVWFTPCGSGGHAIRVSKTPTKISRYREGVCRTREARQACEDLGAGVDLSQQRPEPTNGADYENLMRSRAPT